MHYFEDNVGGDAMTVTILPMRPCPQCGQTVLYRHTLICPVCRRATGHKCEECER